MRQRYLLHAWLVVAVVGCGGGQGEKAKSGSGDAGGVAGSAGGGTATGGSGLAGAGGSAGSADGDAGGMAGGVSGGAGGIAGSGRGGTGGAAGPIAGAGGAGGDTGAAGSGDAGAAGIGCDEADLARAAAAVGTSGIDVRTWTVAPGACGVTRRVVVPMGSLPVRAPVSRQSDGFVVGPLDSMQRWTYIEPGALRATDVSTPSAALLNEFALGPAARLIGIVQGAPCTIEDCLYQSIVFAPGVPGTPMNSLFNAGYRGTVRLGSRPSLDGQHGLFFVGHDVLRDPHVVLLAADGTRVGDVAIVASSSMWDCDLLVPTEQAGAYAVIDKLTDGSEVFHLTELGGTGTVVLDAKVPIQRSTSACPLVAPTATGFAVLLEGSPAVDSGADGTWHYFSIARGGGTTSETWTGMRGRPSAVAVAGGGVVTVMYAEVAGMGGVLRRENGQERRFPLCYGSGAAGFPNAAGILSLADLRSATATAGGVRIISEIECK
jgi:hypothetical protein